MQLDTWQVIVGSVGGSKVLEMALNRVFDRSDKKQSTISDEVLQLRKDVKELQDKLFNFAESNANLRADNRVLGELHKMAIENCGKLQQSYTELEAKYNRLKIEFETFRRLHQKDPC